MADHSISSYVFILLSPFLFFYRCMCWIETFIDFDWQRPRTPIIWNLYEWVTTRKLTHRATNVRNQKQFRFRTFPYPSGEKYISNLKTRFPTTKTNLELIHLKTYASHLSPSTPILIKIMSKMDGRYSRGRKISEIKRSAFAFRLD